LDGECEDDEKSELANSKGEKINIPQRFVVDGDYSKSVKNYLVQGADIRCQPEAWQEIITRSTVSAYVSRSM